MRMLQLFHLGNTSRFFLQHTKELLLRRTRTVGQSYAQSERLGFLLRTRQHPGGVDLCRTAQIAGHFEATSLVLQGQGLHLQSDGRQNQEF